VPARLIDSTFQFKPHGKRWQLSLTPPNFDEVVVAEMILNDQSELVFAWTGKAEEFAPKDLFFVQFLEFELCIVGYESSKTKVRLKSEPYQFAFNKKGRKRARSLFTITAENFKQDSFKEAILPQQMESNLLWTLKGDEVGNEVTFQQKSAVVVGVYQLDEPQPNGQPTFSTSNVTLSFSPSLVYSVKRREDPDSERRPECEFKREFKENFIDKEEFPSKTANALNEHLEITQGNYRSFSDRLSRASQDLAREIEKDIDVYGGAHVEIVFSLMGQIPLFLVRDGHTDDCPKRDKKVELPQAAHPKTIDLRKVNQ